VDEAVVRAIIHAESAFNPNALSRVGAQGLMQLMPATARRFGVGNAFDASQNIAGGVQYLAWLLKRFKGDVALAAAGYNAGEGAVDKYKGVPPYAETQRYVQRVAVLAERYRGALASNALATK
jgi:soluble lytic murein transglycosylase-like protein